MILLLLVLCLFIVVVVPFWFCGVNLCVHSGLAVFWLRERACYIENIVFPCYENFSTKELCHEGGELVNNECKGKLYPQCKKWSSAYLLGSM